MANICLITLLVLFSVVLLSFSAVEGIDKSPEAVEKWFKQIRNNKQITTKLRFYLHATNGGKYGKTVYPVVQPNISLTTPTAFGEISMFDDPLKVGKDPESQIVGTAQGSTSSCAFNEKSLLLMFHLTFTTGIYNDSSLSIIGRNPLKNQYRESAIVGGSGVFRLATGIATQETVSVNPATGDLVIEYNVIVIHYDTKSGRKSDIIASAEMYSSLEM